MVVTKIEKIENSAKKHGYKVCYTNTNIPHVNHTIKTIFMYQHLKGNREILLAHEVGHCYIERFKLIKSEKKASKLKVLLQETLAWLIAFFICRKNKISTEGFMLECKRCLKTYLQWLYIFQRRKV